jgi:hypothetical protein
MYVIKDARRKNIFDFLSIGPDSDAYEIDLGTAVISVRDYLEDNNRTLFLPGGRRYRLNASSSVNGTDACFGAANLTGCAIIGDGSNCTELFLDPNIPRTPVAFDTLTNCRLEGFKINGNIANNTRLGRHNMRLAACEVLRMVDIAFVNSDTYGFGAQGRNPNPYPTLAPNPLTSTTGSRVVRVTWPSHGLVTGDAIKIEDIVNGNGLNNFAPDGGAVTVLDANNFNFNNEFSTTPATATGPFGGNNVRVGKWTYFFRHLYTRDLYFETCGADAFDSKNGAGLNEDWEFTSTVVRTFGVNTPSNLYAGLDFRAKKVRVVAPRVRGTAASTVGIRCRLNDGYNAAEDVTIVGADVDMNAAADTDCIELQGRKCAVIGGHLRGARAGVNQAGAGVNFGGGGDDCSLSGTATISNCSYSVRSIQPTSRIRGVISKSPVLGHTAFSAGSATSSGMIKSRDCTWGESGRPYVNAYQAANIPGVTGDGNFAIVPFSVEIRDEMYNFNPANGRFLVAEAGFYRLSGRIAMGGYNDATHTHLAVYQYVTAGAGAVNAYLFKEYGDPKPNPSGEVFVDFDMEISPPVGQEFAIGLRVFGAPSDVRTISILGGDRRTVLSIRKLVHF